MSDRLARIKKWKLPILGGLVLAGIVVIVVASILLEDFSIRDAIDQLNMWIQSLGAGTFFIALAVLPAFGAPVSPFYVLSGSFGKTLAIVGCLSALTVNIAFTYVLARWLLHPIAEKLVALTGRKIPVVKKEDQWIVAFLLRITPGPPFFIQSYILALAGVPFGIYMAVSVPVVWAYAIGMIIVGESLMTGKGGQLMFGVSLFVAISLIVMMIRRKLQKRAAAAGIPVDIDEPERDETTS
jgi:uncharacterized membrane protein YdjX (TVP38/TMEM64 family)